MLLILLKTFRHTKTVQTSLQFYKTDPHRQTLGYKIEEDPWGKSVVWILIFNKI